MTLSELEAQWKRRPVTAMLVLNSNTAMDGIAHQLQGLPGQELALDEPEIRLDAQKGSTLTVAGTSDAGDWRVPGIDALRFMKVSWLLTATESPGAPLDCRLECRAAIPLGHQEIVLKGAVTGQGALRLQLAEKPPAPLAWPELIMLLGRGGAALPPAELPLKAALQSMTLEFAPGRPGPAELAFSAVLGGTWVLVPELVSVQDFTLSISGGHYLVEGGETRSLFDGGLSGALRLGRTELMASAYLGRRDDLRVELSSAGNPALPALQDLAGMLGVGEQLEASLQQLKSLGLEFALTRIRTIVDLTGPRVAAIEVGGTFIVAGVSVEATALLPGMAFTAQLAEGSHVELPALLEHFLPGKHSLPAVALTGLALSVQPMSGDFGVSARISSDWALGLGDMSLDLQALSLSLSREEGVITAQVLGGFALAGAGFFIGLELPSLKARAGLKEGASLSLTALARGLMRQGLELPQGVPDIVLTQAQLSLAPRTGDFSVNAQATTRWELPVGGGLGVDEAGLKLERMGGEVQTHVFGVTHVAGARFSIDVWLPKLKVSIGLKEGSAINLTGMVRALLPGGLVLPDGLPDLTFSKASASLEARGAAFSLEAASTVPWTFSLGGQPVVSIEKSSITLKRDDKGLTGKLAGTLEVLGITADFTYTIPGSFRIQVSIPEFDVSLPGLMAQLLGGAWTAPDWFPRFTFPQTELYLAREVDRAEAVYSLGLRAQPKGLGVIALHVTRYQGKWGFAAGLDVAVPKLSAISGLEALKPLEETFHLSQLLFVVSSISIPGFQFPSEQAFTHPSLQTKGIVLPESAGGLQPGINVYGRLKLGGTREQDMIRQFLGLAVDAALAMTLQIGLDPGKDARLTAAIEAKIHDNLTLSGQVGGVISSGHAGLFLGGTVKTVIQERPIEFDVTMLAVENGAFVSGTMQGTLGFWGIHLSNLALEIGISYEGVPSAGIAGKLNIDRFDSSIAILFDSANPLRSMVAGAVCNLSLRDVVETLAAPITEVPSELLAALAQVGLKGTRSFTLPGELAQALDNLKVAEISDAFMQHGRVTLGRTLKEVLLIVARRGEAWYITDLERLLHYELHKSGEGITVALETQLHCAPMDTRIGKLQYKQGISLHGALEYFGLKTEAHVTVNLNQGIAIGAECSRIVISNEEFFLISGAQGNGGPRLSLATFSQPEHPEEDFRGPHFFLSGQVGLLGAVGRSVFVKIHAEGLHCKLEGELIPGTIFDLGVDFTSLSQLSASGSAHVTLSPIELGQLGHVSIPGGASGTVGAKFSGGVATAVFEAGFALDENMKFTIPAFTLAVDQSPLRDLAGLLAEKIKLLLQDFLREAGQWVGWVKKGIVQGIEDAPQMAQVLKGHFAQNVEETARMLKDFGYQAEQLAEALKENHGIAGEALAPLLRSLGFGTHQIAAVLKDVYTLTAREAGRSLQLAGYAFFEIAEQLKETYGQGAEEAADLLRSLGVTGHDIAGFLRQVYEVRAEHTARILKALGAGVREIDEALRSVFSLHPEDIVRLLWQEGYDRDEILRYLRDLSGGNLQEVARFLSTVMNPHEVANLLRDMVGLSPEAAMRILSHLYGLHEAMAHLRHTFSVGPEEAARVLRDLGYDVNLIVRNLLEFYNLGTEQVAQLLMHTGFAGEQVAQALMHIGFAVEQVTGVLMNIFGWHLERIHEFLNRRP